MTSNLPFFNQLIFGSGEPVALQRNVVPALRRTTTLCGSSIKAGLAPN